MSQPIPVSTPERSRDREWQPSKRSLLKSSSPPYPIPINPNRIHYTPLPHLYLHFHCTSSSGQNPLPNGIKDRAEVISCAVVVAAVSIHIRFQPAAYLHLYLYLYLRRLGIRRSHATIRAVLTLGLDSQPVHVAETGSLSLPLKRIRQAIFRITVRLYSESHPHLHSLRIRSNLNGLQISKLPSHSNYNELPRVVFGFFPISIGEAHAPSLQAHTLVFPEFRAQRCYHGVSLERGFIYIGVGVPHSGVA
ncbi:hypothetical protein BT96DRAFT_1010591 [Gymnopus androsaceus JB14]|uniref:Uncharacterized protein n=1 Tax=Gymnopus androsaceus JB14 TaxID=1447944 RepID=A0A6A4GAI0_9AGAR|nr:hypothetical protein BT96DRAFT_1010591 [Gymnopus androsaceus JB14]